MRVKESYMNAYQLISCKKEHERITHE